MLFSEVSDNEISLIEGIILREFMTWETRSVDELVSAVYAYDENGGPESANQTIKQFIFRLRRKLTKDWTIEKLRTHNYIFKKKRKKNDLS